MRVVGVAGGDGAAQLTPAFKQGDLRRRLMAAVAVLDPDQTEAGGQLDYPVTNLHFHFAPLGEARAADKHRHGRHQATPQIALLEGWGELRGAIATSYSHDSHNLVVLGRDANDMALAANQLIASGGGMALAQALKTRYGGSQSATWLLRSRSSRN